MDDDGYCRPSVLPVAKFNDYDPAKPPSSGEDYLRRVQLEAQRCPEVAVADLDLEMFVDNQTETIKETNGFFPAVTNNTFPVEKQHECVAYFSELRSKVHNLRSRSHLTKPTCPNINDHQAWKSYIMGDTSEGTSNSRSQLPLLTLLLTLSQTDHHQLLKYIVKWTQTDGFDERCGLWIFSILACLEKPLQSEVYATLRDVSRMCSTWRRENDLGPDDLKSINIIVCLIGRYFDQKDMIDQ